MVDAVVEGKRIPSHRRPRDGGQLRLHIVVERTALPLCPVPFIAEDDAAFPLVFCPRDGAPAIVSLS